MFGLRSGDLDGARREASDMRRFVLAAAGFLAITGFPCGQELWAQAVPPPPPPVPQVTPQLNVPGPQLTIPQPPSTQPAAPSAAAPPAVPESSSAPAAQPRQRSTRHRTVSPRQRSSRTSVAQQGASCSFRHCIQRCMDTGQVFFIVGRRTGSSCQDQCKHKGCSDRAWFLSDP